METFKDEIKNLKAITRVIAVQLGSLFGLVPAAAFVPVFIVGGVVLFPIFVLGISVAFQSYTPSE